MPNKKSTIYINGLSVIIGTITYLIVVVHQSFFRVYGYYGDMYEAVSDYYNGMGLFYFFYSIILICLLRVQITKLSTFKWGALYIIFPTLIPMIAWYFYTCLKQSIYQKSCFDMSLYDFLIRVLISFIGSYSYVFVMFSVASFTLLVAIKKLVLKYENKK
ncbi:MAG TPA: hypothetical protein DIT05_12355 [Morganella sp. (in: Bacteria)]|nr:hypothetical protein [Morganella sp. (in: enterobacteria)]